MLASLAERVGVHVPMYRGQGNNGALVVALERTWKEANKGRTWMQFPSAGQVPISAAANVPLMRQKLEGAGQFPTSTRAGQWLPKKSILAPTQGKAWGR